MELDLQHFIYILSNFNFFYDSCILYFYTFVFIDLLFKFISKIIKDNTNNMFPMYQISVV